MRTCLGSAVLARRAARGWLQAANPCGGCAGPSGTRVRHRTDSALQSALDCRLRFASAALIKTDPRPTEWLRTLAAPEPAPPKQSHRAPGAIDFRHSMRPTAEPTELRAQISAVESSEVLKQLILIWARELCRVRSQLQLGAGLGASSNGSAARSQTESFKVRRWRRL